MGRQFANDAATPSPVSVSRDQYKNEIPSDPGEEHNNSTPGMGSFHWEGKQYSDDWMGGNKNYGVAVTPPSATTVTVRGDDASRRKES